MPKAFMISRKRSHASAPYSMDQGNHGTTSSTTTTGPTLVNHNGVWSPVTPPPSPDEVTPENLSLKPYDNKKRHGSTSSSKSSLYSSSSASSPSSAHLHPILQSSLVNLLQTAIASSQAAVAPSPVATAKATPTTAAAPTQPRQAVYNLKHHILQASLTQRDEDENEVVDLSRTSSISSSSTSSKVTLISPSHPHHQYDGGYGTTSESEQDYDHQGKSNADLFALPFPY